MNNLICVEYPGLVKDPDKMLETVGGIVELSKVGLFINERFKK